MSNLRFNVEIALSIENLKRSSFASARTAIERVSATRQLQAVNATSRRFCYGIPARMQPKRLTRRQERFGPFSRLAQGSMGGCSARMFNGGPRFRPVFKQQPHSCRPASKVNCASCIETASCQPGSKPFRAAATVIAKAIESSVCNIYRGDTHILSAAVVMIL